MSVELRPMRIKVFITISLLFLFSPLWAQYSSEQGQFEVTDQRGCAPLTISITNSKCGSVPCSIDYEGNGDISNDLTYTYDTPGTYWLYNTISTEGTDSIQIEVLDSTLPEFELYACEGNGVIYNITDTRYDEYELNFNDGSSSTIVNSLATGMHTYATSGSQTVSLKGIYNNAADNCTPQTYSFTAVNTLTTPHLDELTVVDDASIQINATTQDYFQYRLEIATDNASTFQFLQTVYNQSTVDITTVTPDTHYYCFRMGIYDPCNSSILGYSNILCSADLDLTILDEINRLTWNTATTPASYFGTVTSYELFIDNQSSLVLPSSQDSHDDVDITCNTAYCYQLVTQYDDGISPAFSYSAIKCGTAISTQTPASIEDISTVVGEGDVLLEWVQDPGYTADLYDIQRSQNGDTYQTIGQTDQITFTDADYETDAAICYTIQYTDACNNASDPGITACPLALSGNLQDDNSVVLSWNAYDGWQNGVDYYRVERYDNQGNLLQSFNAGTAISYTDDAADDEDHQQYIYIVYAVPVDAGLTESVSNVIIVLKEPNIFYPTAFTPNADGLNDIFKVFGHYIATFKMSIFNRWGEPIYLSTDITEGWDGTYHGKQMPEGTYAFTVDMTDLSGRKYHRSGGIVLLRKR